MKRLWSMVLAMVLLLTAMAAVFAEGETKYLQLQKTDTTGVINYTMLKNLQGFLTAGCGSVTLRADMKIDKIEGADGIQLYQTGPWQEYGYLRQDGASGIKFVVKGSNATDASGASVSAETERKGLQLGEWYSYEFTFTMQEPYTTTITVRQGDKTVVEPISWSNIAGWGNFAWTLRTNTQVKMDVKNLKVIGKNAGTETVLEDRTYQETAEGNYYGGTTDAVGGVDNKTRTSKLIVLGIPDPPKPPAEEGESPELPPLDEGAVVLEQRTFQEETVGSYTNSIGLGDASKASAQILQEDANRYLELKQTQTGNKLMYYILKGFSNYRQKYGKINLDLDLRMSDFSAESNGVKVWSFAQTFGIFTQKDRMNYKQGGIAEPDLVPGGLAAGEWHHCKMSFDFRNAKMTLQLGETSCETVFTAETAGNLALEFDNASTGVFCIDNIVISGIEAGSEPIPTVNQTEFYVAQNGNDENEGTITAPFRTLEKAKEMVRRAVANEELPQGPITVYLRGGVYPISKTVTFSGTDSGTAKHPVVYRPYEEEEVRFIGGIVLPSGSATKVTDPDILNRVVEEQARDKLMQIDLGAAGVTSIPAIDDHGFGGNMPSSFQNYRPFEVYFNGQALSRSRYPNDEPNTAFLRTGEAITAGSTTEPFTIVYQDPENRTAHWDFSKMKDLFISGFIGNDWAGVNHRVAALDTVNKQLTSQGGSSYPATANHRLYFWNLLEEIDMPGESYIDRENKIVYFYPPSDPSDAEITVPTFDGIMFQMSGCKYLTLQGFTCDTTRNRMVVMTGCVNVTLDGCTFARGSSGAVSVNGSNCTVKNCHIYEMGAGGIQVNGGDINNLTPSGNVIENNRIHSFNRVYNSSVPGIMVSGVGQAIRHNAIYDAPHILVQLNSAPDTLLEYNEIYNGVLEASDVGAVYWGRKPEETGVTIRYNYFHDIGNQYGGYGQSCVFYDDGAIGPELYGNLFYRGTRTVDQGGTSANCFAIKTHGGQYGNIQNNIFIDVPLAVRIQPWNNSGTEKQTRWWLWVQNTVNPMTRLKSQAWLNHYQNTIWAQYQSLFTEGTYQQLKATGALNPQKPTTEQFNLAKDNAPTVTHTFKDNLTVGVGRKDGSVFWGYATESGTVSYDDLEKGKALFQNFDGRDFRLTAAALQQIQASNPDFQNIPFEQMGLTATVGGTAPTAQNTSIKGVASPGSTLTAQYLFADEDGDAEGNSRIIWYMGDSANGEFNRIPGKQGKTILVDQAYLGKYLRFEVTPYDRNMRYGVPALSKPVQILTGESVAQRLQDAIQKAQSFSETVTVGAQFGQISSQAKERLQAAIQVAQRADTETLQQEAYQNLESAMEDARGAVVQDPSTISEGQYHIFDFMQDFEATLEQGKIAVLSLPRGVALPAMKITGRVTVDDTPRQAVFTLPKGTVIAGNGRVDLTLFRESHTAVPDLQGEKLTTLFLTEDQLRLSQPASLWMEGAWNKRSVFRAGSKLENIGSSTLETKGYGREKSGEKDLLLTTDRLGEIILFTPTGSVTDSPKPTPTPSGGKVPQSGGTVGNVGVGTTAVPSSEVKPTPQPATRFTDLQGHWAEAEVNEMANRGIVSGVTDTTFEPDRPITRAEFATLAAKALNLKSDIVADFSDVPQNAWYTPFVNAAANAGLISGYDGQFRPEDLITREEMAVVLVKLYQFRGGELLSGKISEFTDRDQIADWALDYADQAVSTGFIYGVTATTFGPKEHATRAQVTAVLCRILKQ